MESYSPFDKPFREITTSDLVKLNSIQEGWYIEYKSQITNASSIAKSISAFSNTYGGWLFYGIKEKSKDDAVAGAFPGIALTEIDALQQTVRQATATLVSPSPHFELVVLHGPCIEINLQEDRAIICVHIPRSFNTPHVHKSGQIYRRVADGSEPKPENDRFLLDQLWNRATRFKKGYRKWVKRKPAFSKAETEAPFIRLLITPDLWADHNLNIDLDVDNIRNIINQDNVFGINVPFETVYSTASGVVARQTKAQDPHNIGLVWKLWPDLSSEILIPISRFYVKNIGLTAYELRGYKHGERFRSILEEQNYSTASIIDLNFLFYILVGIVKIQSRLCGAAEWNGSWFFKARLLNMWRVTPFLDIKDSMERFEAHGVPMCLDSEVTIPPGFDPETFAEVPSYSHIDLQEARDVIRAQLIFSVIANAYGIPPTLIPAETDSERSLYEELCAAGSRAIEAQNVRNKRA